MAGEGLLGKREARDEIFDFVLASIDFEYPKSLVRDTLRPRRKRKEGSK